MLHRHTAVALLVTMSAVFAASSRGALFSRFRVQGSEVIKNRNPEGTKKVIIIGRRGIEDGDETWELFLARVRHAASGLPTFAGHYAIVEWSCGASCINSAVVDTDSGRVTLIPFNVLTFCRDHTTPGFDFRVDSRLLVAEGDIEWKRQSQIPAATGNSCTHFFEWNGRDLKQVHPKVPRR